MIVSIRLTNDSSLHIIPRQGRDKMNDTNYIRDSVKLIVEQIGDDLKITHADLEVIDVYHITIEFIGMLADATKQDYNSVVEDLKEK